MIAPGIAVINQSTVVANEDARRMTQACAKQMDDFCDVWSRLRIAVTFYTSPGDVPEGMPTLSIGDDAKEPGAFAWHSQNTKGAIIGLIGAQTNLDAGGGILSGSPSVSSDLSHELLETAVDPFVNLWADMPNGKSEVAREVCDPVQDESYEIDGVAVSSWVYPAWFNDRLPVGEPVDKLGSLSRPFTRTSGGYFVLRADGRTRQEGRMVPHKEGNPDARGARRLASGGAAAGLDRGTLDAIRAQSHDHGAGVAQIVADVIQRAAKKLAG